MNDYRKVDRECLIGPLRLASSARDECPLFEAEKDTGSVEYKWKLLNKSAERVSHLTTQLNYRLTEGGGACVYKLGVIDNGFPEGLSEDDLRDTCASLQRMAHSANAEVRLSHVKKGRRGLVAEVIVERQLSSSVTSGRDLHVALIGEAHAGKSTLLGVLCTGKLDNGRGSARLNVFTHRHEVESGHTQTVSRQLVGFDCEGRCTNHRNESACNSFNVHAWASIAHEAVTLISFYDCVGIASGQKTTISALLTHEIDYAVFIISCETGISKIDHEHLVSCAALDLPVIAVITKSDLCVNTRLQAARTEIQEALYAAYMQAAPLRSCHTFPILNESEIEQCLALLLTHRTTPIFSLSSHTGENVNLFTSFLWRLPKLKDWSLAERSSLEFCVDSVYEVNERSIIGGIILSGVVEVGQRILIGPLGVQARFAAALVTSIHIKRQPALRAKAGQVASLALAVALAKDSFSHSDLRRGLVVLDADSCTDPHVTRTFTARMRLESSAESLHTGAQPMVYLPNIRQSVVVLNVNFVKDLESSNRPNVEVDVELQFCHTAEFLRPGARCFLTEAGVKAKGAVTIVKGDATDTPRLRRKRRKSSKSESES